MSEADKANLDDWKIQNVLLRPCTAKAAEDGYYWPVPNSGAELDAETKELYWELGKAQGYSDAMIEELWAQFCAYRLSGEAPELEIVRSASQSNSLIERALEDAAAWREAWEAKRKPEDDGE